MRRIGACVRARVVVFFLLWPVPTAECAMLGAAVGCPPTVAFVAVAGREGWHRPANPVVAGAENDARVVDSRRVDGVLWCRTSLLEPQNLN